MKKLRLIVAALAASLFLTGGALAQTVETMVTMTYTGSCMLTSQPLHFEVVNIGGALDGTTVTSETEFTLSCVPDLPSFIITMDRGSNQDGNGDRNVADGTAAPNTNFMVYRIFQPASETDASKSSNPWGDDDVTISGASLPVSGGASFTIAVHGELFIPAESASPGQYSDTVTVAVVL